MQENSLESLISGEGQLDMSIGELEMIVEYLNDHHSVSKSHYKNLIAGITRYLTKSSKQYGDMSNHISDLTKKIEGAQLNMHLTKTEKLVANMKNQFEAISKKVKGISIDTTEVHKNLSNAKKVMSEYLSHVESIPQKIKEMTKNDKGQSGAKVMEKVTTRTVWFMMALLLVIAITFVLFNVLLAQDKNRALL